MVQPELAHKMRLIEAVCKVCGRLVSFEVEDRARDNYPFSYIFYHGTPVHALVTYIDQNYMVRSNEVIEEFGGEITIPSEKVSKKCIVTGDWGVGKTSFIQRIVKDLFVNEYDPTVEETTLACVFVLPDKRSLDIEFWDARGQHGNFKEESSWWEFASDADAVIFMGDVTKPHTFNLMGEILNDVKKFVKKHAIFIGIANKIDCKKDRKVSATELATYQKKYKFPIFEMSVKQKDNLNEILNHLITKLGIE